jgi:hypothetical protein
VVSYITPILTTPPPHHMHAFRNFPRHCVSPNMASKPVNSYLEVSPLSPCQGAPAFDEAVCLEVVSFALVPSCDTLSRSYPVGWSRLQALGVQPARPHTQCGGKHVVHHASFPTTTHSTYIDLLQHNDAFGCSLYPSGRGGSLLGFDDTWSLLPRPAR